MKQASISSIDHIAKAPPPASLTVRELPRDPAVRRVAFSLCYAASVYATPGDLAEAMEQSRLTHRR
jgi:hypothetical protein